ncbi:carboxynorspermidine decarboxylase [Umezakia ovalisporum]|jgi:carboxynorspermidine decarboxylase|uniref:Carboxynorspermidine decarboxylase n=2 Tax=Umezakia ovalisporum TaxID=75695 RepID=A0AA43GZS0_9CYAN|nr:carboxynorspermidine decarboxylase [Umezakia ovalisporum]MBI1241175.1 carboxynorspermidine decarboxylase [Nostoc sp. RI_552]MDH6057757.1 carboxynorspermidine decarboxylase [Umezakia ovalisporum FSS-43]MDH6064789.1 carboxynorspermidine decarboxylase [Umezakia ovalisporum FSS-62]MDH6067389.1 carboxynorspermidine decarboxylase [Umezakia ovalisporum APH033B]MDH6070344.1 carboxynorspermidine decarboxylase [Umezakia ovalisporum CobakiLakeA]
MMIQRNTSVLANIPSPCFVLQEELLEGNLAVFQRVQQEAPVKILLALKAFALFHSFPLIRQTLKGASASSLWEAQLAAQEFGGDLHIYSPAYRDQDMTGILTYANHVTFNSISQWKRFYPLIEHLSAPPSVGLRINPQYSPVETALYNPCQPYTRLGVSPEHLGNVLPTGIDGFLSHNLCESDSYALEKTLLHIEDLFGQFLPQLKWLNLGGGHLMTRQGYDVGHAVKVLTEFHQRYPHIQLIMEPGSAITWETGFLLSTVQDIISTANVTNLMLDVSFTAHMPDCLEMPYKPVICGAHEPQPGDKIYRMGGSSCLAGDFMGDYAFTEELSVGHRIIFEDMMHYTMVKTTMFNGVVHPSIGILKKDGTFEIWREFSYPDYRARVG